MKKNSIGFVTCGIVLMLLSGFASAQGFYGGFAVRPKNLDPAAALFATQSQSLSWLKPSGEEPSQQAMVYGGYRLYPGLGLEASLTRSERLGLRFDPRSFGLTAGDPTSRAWNLDVYTSLALQPSLAVYGRVGYEQPNPVPQLAPSATDISLRRQAIGLNYGVGVRYDLNSGMGVRLEWARPYRSATTANLSEPPRPGESDQLSVGLQFRF
jgi:opacity protein-like surface antigen